MTEQTMIVLRPAEWRELKDRLARIEERLSPPKEWWSIPEAATRLGCTESTVRRKIARGEIEAKGTGKTRRVRLP